MLYACACRTAGQVHAAILWHALPVKIIDLANKRIGCPWPTSRTYLNRTPGCASHSSVWEPTDTR
jgi:hypothetical protein